MYQAVRQGWWILLDEINLASQETLQRLSGLLEDKRGTVSLTERGDVEAVTRHPDFRLFAAMNPPTDVGKKDLPPSLRCRFTEIFVEDVEEKEDLHIIAADCLRPVAQFDPPLDALVNFYLNARQESRLSLVDGAGQRPRYSLRTWCRALRYATELVRVKYSLSRALFEGLCMAFCTQLDGDSAKVMELKALKLLGLKESDNRNPPPCPGRDAKRYVLVETFWLPRGPLDPIDRSLPGSAGHVAFVMVPSVRRHIRFLARAVLSARFPVLLQGPTSSGKTSMVEYLAARTGHRCIRINNHEHTDLQEYSGTYVPDETGRLVFQDGALVEAMRVGAWVILDELNLAPSEVRRSAAATWGCVKCARAPQVLEALNRLLDDNREFLIPETTEVVVPHESFRLFATQNPPGVYGGRKVLSAAFKNRFLELHVDDMPSNELEDVICLRSQLPRQFCRPMVAVQQELQRLRQGSQVFAGKHGFITPRDLLRWAGRKPSTYEELATAGFMLLGERLRREEEKQVVREVIEKHCKARVNAEAWYARHHEELISKFLGDHGRAGAHSGDGNAVLGTEGVASVTWTRYLRRLFVLASECVRFGEPVMLVGETGCGKTMVCQLIALLLERPLHIVNCHQHSEAADFLGSLRPSRNRDVLFEWQDGPLTEAMRRGHLFLLDEMSLAEDAVLERLNSVLEPAKFLLLAEKGGVRAAGGTVCVEQVVAAEGFAVFATMNPGGDFGKRELSPAMRNRFTEVWVPAMNDLDDMRAILRDRMQLHAVALARFVDPIMDFVAWFNAQDEGVVKASPMTLRDVIAWGEFLCAMPRSGDVDEWISFVHGACMVVLDGLGLGTGAARSSCTAFRVASLARLVASVPGEVSAACATSVALDSVPRLVLADSTFGVPPFVIDRAGAALGPAAYAFDAPTTSRNVLRILRALKLHKPVMLEGSPGVGKSSIVEAMARATGNVLVRINLSEQTDLADLLGSDLPAPSGESGAESACAFRWCDGVFLKALRSGHWVLLDELNLASQAVLEGLNSCLDHRASVFIPELGRAFACPPSFRVFAAQNPLGQGGGRKGLPRSFLNRFSKVHIDVLSPDDLLCIATYVYRDVPAATLSAIIAFNATLQAEFGAGALWEFNLRDTFRLCDLMRNLGSTNAAMSVDLIYMQRTRNVADRGRVRRTFEGVFGYGVAEEYCPRLIVEERWVRLGSARVERCLGLRPNCPAAVLTPQCCRTLQHVLKCVEMRWPTLLVGDSGSGKTVALEAAAALCNRELVRISVTSDTDTTDLLGCFEQVDNARQLRTIVAEVEPLVLLCVQAGSWECASGSATAAGRWAAMWNLWWALQKRMEQNGSATDEQAFGDDLTMVRASARLTCTARTKRKYVRR